MYIWEWPKEPAIRKLNPCKSCLESLYQICQYSKSLTFDSFKELFEELFYIDDQEPIVENESLILLGNWGKLCGLFTIYITELGLNMKSCDADTDNSWQAKRFDHSLKFQSETFARSNTFWASARVLYTFKTLFLLKQQHGLKHASAFAS